MAGGEVVRPRRPPLTFQPLEQVEHAALFIRGRLSMPLKSTLALAAAFIAAAGIGAWVLFAGGADATSGADANDPALVALGKRVYAKACASCHGADRQGETNWKQRKPDGTFGAPPHDASGHTWHHPDALLFRITKFGGASVAPADFKSGMPAFKDQLSDREIWAVLAFIKNRWPERVRTIQARINARNR
jgi:mono/diheme cytochrome c family protein